MRASETSYQVLSLRSGGRVEVLAASLGTLPPAHAHQDRLLSLGPDGEIEGVPALYGPASFEFLRTPRGPAASATLQLRGGSFRFPRCLLAVLGLTSKSVIRLRGSWYHERGSLPPYLVVDVSGEGPSIGSAGYSLLFSLETAQLLQVVRTESTGSTVKRKPAYVELCGGEEPSPSAPVVGAAENGPSVPRDFERR